MFQWTHVQLFPGTRTRNCSVNECKKKPNMLWCMDTCWMMHHVASCQKPAWFGVCVWCSVPGSFFIAELHFVRTEPPSTLLPVLEGTGWMEKYFTHTHVHTPRWQNLLYLYLHVYLPDDDLVEFETCMRNISDKRLFIIDCAVCWFEYCVIHGAQCS